MWPRIYPGWKNFPNTSGTSETFWGVTDFHICDQFMGFKYLWLCSLIVCFAFGFPACVAIFWEMLKTHRRSLFTPNDVFTLNLTVMDTVFLIYALPGLVNHVHFHSKVFEATWNWVYCLNMCGRPLLMACVCLDCYLAVVHPVTYRKHKSLTPRIVVVGIIWILTTAAGIAYAMSDKLFLTMFPTVPYIITIVIIGFCDSFIIHRLIKFDPGKNGIHPQKKRAIHTLTNSLVMTLISYLPPVLMYTFGIPLISNPVIFLCTVGIPVSITSSLGSAVMPLLYLENTGKLERFKCHT